MIKPVIYFDTWVVDQRLLAHVHQAFFIPKLRDDEVESWKRLVWDNCDLDAREWRVIHYHSWIPWIARLWRRGLQDVKIL